jgi:chromosome segregation ATPase
MVKVLQQDVEELEAESNGLTDEIRGLKSRLEISNQELSEKNAQIIELEKMLHPHFLKLLEAPQPSCNRRGLSLYFQ